LGARAVAFLVLGSLPGRKESNMKDLVPKAPLLFLSVPTPNEWKSKSYVGKFFVQRSSDRVLTRIDDLVSGLNRSGLDDGSRKYLLAELYYSTNYWLNYCEGNPNVQLERRQAVRALKEVVERTLAKSLGAAPLLVGPELEKHYGCSLTFHGIYKDETDEPRYFKEREKRERYKIFFRDGKALWHEWWMSQTSKLKPVDTKEACQRSSFSLQQQEGGPLLSGYGFLVMTSYRDIYVAPHRMDAIAPGMPKFHSTIPAGKSVQFAGSILIQGGIVKAIRNDSGHYHPDDTFFINILEQLRTVGVRLKGVQLFNYKGEDVSKDAEDYLNKRGNWGKIEERVKQSQRHQSAMAFRTSALLSRNKSMYEMLNRVEYGKPEPQGLPVLLQLLFEERYDGLKGDMRYQGTPPGSLWTTAWTDVLEGLFKYFEIDDKKKAAAWKAKLDHYKLAPPVPPRHPT
jgi:hypothetical protein